MNFPRSVYAIKHKKTNRMYIGSSQDAETRIRNHISNLRSGKHTNKEMLSDYKKHGEDYEFFILDKITSYSQRYREYELMDKYKTRDVKFGYNNRDRGGTSERITFETGLPDIPK